ncbi:MAG: cytochrome c [Candidatus Ruthia sp.]|nr:cytochrome c [Candidatus Ruthturnera sp.]MBT6922031.1 cytochrome c [Candidatus Ruthturnera sp.]
MNKIKTMLLVFIILVSSAVFSDESAADKRATIYLDDEERAIVLEEMRTFLSTIQKITQGIVADDMVQVSHAAKTMGNNASAGVSLSLIFKLPLGFKLLAADTHQKFDEIAIDASSFADREHALEQTSVLMKNCVSCHATYRIDLEED